jgi:ABC-type molybdate transport system substrate-binding protein
MRLRAIAVMAMALSAAAAAHEPPVRLYAAGSLRAVMTDLGQSFRAAGGAEIAPTFAASGLLRERIENGERTDVFASADVGNAQKLADLGRSSPPIVFARNELCALAGPGVAVTTDNLLERMLDPAIKLGTSTPRSDPSGDYAWQLFEKAEQVRPGTFAQLDSKALKLTGSPDSPPPPADRSVYGLLLAERKADIVLTYCTNAVVAAREVSGARVVPVPAALAVGASYALVVLTDANPAAGPFALYVMSIPGQAVLAKHGFTPVASPSPIARVRRMASLARKLEAKRPR